MTIKHISPAEAFAFMSHGAALIDIREKDEWQRESIPGAIHRPLSAIERNPPKVEGTAIFHCRSGNRTAVNAQRLAALLPGVKVFVLDGSIEAWRDAGLPTLRDSRKPIEIIRQVQIGASTIILAGATLAAFVHPAFLGLVAFVGAGLLFAGATGFCGMAKLLSRAPWNRTAAESSIT